MKSYRGSLKSPFGYAALSVRLYGDNPMDAVKEYFSRHFPDLKIIGISDEKLESENILADFWIEHSGREFTHWDKVGQKSVLRYNDRISVDKEI